jgi:hypothetical protein
VAGDALHFGDIVGVDDDLVAGADELEHGVDLADSLGVGSQPQFDAVLPERSLAC